MSLLGRAARRILRSLAHVPTLDPFADLERLLQGRPVATVFDVGGCLGEYAVRFAATWPYARVWSFEPNPVTFRRLAASVSAEPRIQAVPLGVWNRSGSLPFFVNQWAGASSVLDRPHNGPAYHHARAQHVDRTEVQVVRLDEWAQQQGVASIDLLKLDIQGAELQALQGAGELLGTVRCILTEVHYFANYQGAHLLDELWSFLRGRGFSLYQLYSSWGAADGQIVQGDAIFVSEALRRERLLGGDRPFESVQYHL